MAKDTAQPKDQSMEEILQSIKRIIAEEGSDASKSASSANGVSEDTLVTGSNLLELQDLSSPDENVLELTEEIDDPTTTVNMAAHTVPLLANSDDDSKRDVLADIDSLLSEDAAKVSSAALRALSQAGSRREVHRSPSHAFRHGVTVEDLVVESLKPMLKEWLDQNLPEMVQQMVEKEIRKLTT